MRKSALGMLFAALVCAPALPAAAQGRTWNLLPTGNGHGFQVFDRTQNRITYFLEHPYRFVAPGDDGRTTGIGRRDLAYDLYFGVRVGSTTKWLNKCGNSECQDFTNVEYENQSHIIKASTSTLGAGIDTYYFAPFGYGGNAMVMLMKLTNNTGSPLNISAFAKANMKLGNGRVDPDGSGEQLRWLGSATPPRAEETGSGGGHVLYFPLNDATRVGCGTDSAVYNSVLQSGTVGTTQTCNGNDQVFGFQKDLTIAAGEEGWWGVAVLFLNDNPNDARAASFRDTRTIDEIANLWKTFVGTKDPKTLHDSALQEMETWRTNTMPSGLSDTERKLWRQSEVVLRMGQIREKARKNDGMVLASLAPGEWHTGWTRDGVYGTVALALTGHVEEAKKSVEFLIGTDAGFFKAGNYVGRDYRVGSCRYFGNGLEEADFNQDGPNIETDGWGLVLWAARTTAHMSCDKNWLSQTTWRGDSVLAGLAATAADMEAYRSNGLPKPDASIWEVHWDRRQVFSYTAACWVRGFHDFAELAAWSGDATTATRYRTMANDMLAKSKQALVHTPTQSFASHLNVAGNDVHVDGSTMAFLDFGLIPPSDPLFSGTLNSFSKLVTGYGGYRRLEPQLSLTGGGSAGTYDLAEWILLDLRIADMWRKAGNTSKANELLDKVTAQAAANDNLVPELFDPNNGRYTGVVPMVGYGAGAWMMSQLIKHGANPPAIDAGFGHCSACRSNPCTGANEVCVEQAPGGFRCDCMAGFHKEGNVCVADTVCNAATTCSGHGTCSGQGTACTCNAGYTGTNCQSCATGFHTEGASCVADTACNPNPCTDANRTTCQANGAEHTCLCNSGYTLQDGACVAVGGADGGTGRIKDGPALICGVPGHGASDGALVLAVVLLLALWWRRRVEVRR